jgi:aspartyl-tRNA(Asn)/glutamyl-tRNA(Gln) amidotransferase subunit A
VSEELFYLSITELAPRLERREISCKELVQACISRTENLDRRLNSYISFLPERALAEAEEVDRAIGRGEYRGPLHGIPVSIKDLFDIAGLPTSAGARFLMKQVPEKDSVVARRLREAGTVLLGKSNLNKFAGGESGDNPDFGKMRNPWNPEFSPGGSSGGSGVQVAAGMAALSVGSDNGGSVRIPAALCGVVGLKPTHGRISMEGMFPRAYTLDHAGPLTRTVEDCAIALSVLAGHERGDPTTLNRPVPSYRQEMKKPVRGLKLGVDRKYAGLGEPAVLAAFERAVADLVALGALVREVSLPPVEALNEVMYAHFYPEWGAAHERWLRERPEEYGFSGARAALLIPAVDYIKATQRRRLLQVDYARATREVDLLATPTYPLARRPFGEYPLVAGKRLSFDDALRYTMPFDLLGLPALSLPCGFSPEGFPIGLQLVGRAFEEATVLRAAYAFEQSTDWHRRRPPMA